jgi:internalin A
LYLLVLNGRQGHEDADADYWLSLIDSFGEGSPVLVVLNKIKEHPFDLNRRALMQKFGIVRGFVETDCKDRTGIEDLQKTIIRENDHLEHLRDAFPASWFGIKDRLAGMQANYISYDEYRKICRENGEGEGAAQEALASYLHSLGIALNYKDDPRLRDTHVLNPRWVTEGIYKILNAEDLARRKGELQVDALPGVLDPDAYPPERHGFLLELMRKFELCFTFPDDQGRYLIPELLDKQQPAEAERFDPDQCLNFQYHYPVLLEGLLPRFIVRTHVLSTEQPRWRTGVILDWEGNQALVKADKEAKRVFIGVKGPTSRGRRELLSVIRYDFEHIHRSFKFTPQELIPVPGAPDVLVPYQELLVMERNGIRKFHKVAGDRVLE